MLWSSPAGLSTYLPTSSGDGRPTCCCSSLICIAWFYSWREQKGLNGSLVSNMMQRLCRSAHSLIHPLTWMTWNKTETAFEIPFNGDEKASLNASVTSPSAVKISSIASIASSMVAAVQVHNQRPCPKVRFSCKIQILCGRILNFISLLPIMGGKTSSVT